MALVVARTDGGVIAAQAFWRLVSGRASHDVDDAVVGSGADQVPCTHECIADWPELIL
ncbi:hypothetical protein HN358_04275 [Candidatus Uhrbacteria bacterium]|nr:hypothetical protein [Candidatus Uhrbacteria bacterium]MBT7717000.1 hypothetical protein [Candidatus Uhrbacteria bacterium]